MNISKIINDLEQLPMEGNSSQLDRAIQDFLDYLYERKEKQQ